MLLKLKDRAILALLNKDCDEISSLCTEADKLVITNIREYYRFKDFEKLLRNIEASMLNITEFDIKDFHKRLASI